MSQMPFGFQVVCEKYVPAFWAGKRKVCRKCLSAFKLFASSLFNWRADDRRGIVANAFRLSSCLRGLKRAAALCEHFEGRKCLSAFKLFASQPQGGRGRETFGRVANAFRLSSCLRGSRGVRFAGRRHVRRKCLSAFKLFASLSERMNFSLVNCWEGRKCLSAFKLFASVSKNGSCGQGIL